MAGIGVARLISMTGFGLVALGACTIAVPYLLRSAWYARAIAAVGFKGVPLLRRMRPHYWLARVFQQPAVETAPMGPAAAQSALGGLGTDMSTART
ncbi:MAG TPA: hypothetical protein VF116_20695 [Ktedonobacterales bacterium]